MTKNLKKLTLLKSIKIKQIIIFAKECSYCGRKLDDNGKCPICG